MTYNNSRMVFLFGRHKAMSDTKINRPAIYSLVRFGILAIVTQLKVSCLIAVLLMATFFGCSSFKSDFSRIDENKLRVIGVTYLPTPEVAPGDTMTARIYFAGDAVTNVDNFATSDETTLSVCTTRSWLPDSFEYSFVIPDSIFLHYPSLYLDSDVSDSMAYLMMQSASSIDSMLLTFTQEKRDQFLSRLRRMSRLSTTYFSAHATNGTMLRVKSDYQIRYNTRLPHILPVNHNPHIGWLAIYAVPLVYSTAFSPYNFVGETGVKKNFLFNETNPDSVDTSVVIDTGYSYFLVVDNGLQQHTDSLYSHQEFDVTFDGVSLGEYNRYQWFFQNTDDATDDFDSLIIIEKDNLPVIQFIPPLVKSMRRFKFWAMAYDQVDAYNIEHVRGMGYRGVSGIFEFTDAYIQSIEGK